MKKKILMLITLLLVSFIVNDNVKAYTCEYGTLEDTSETGYDLKVTLDLNKDSKTIKLVYDSSPEIKNNDVCVTAESGRYDGVCEKSSVNTSNDGAQISCSYGFDFNECPGSFGESDNFTAVFGDIDNAETVNGIFNTYDNSCPPILYLYSQRGFKNINCYSFSEDQAACASFADNIQSTLTYYNKGVDKEEADKLNKENCFFFDIYKHELESTLTNGNCEGNSDFTIAYQKFSSRCANYLSSHLYTTQEENSDDYHANPCASKCAALRDTISRMCMFNENDDNCDSLGARLLNWIYRMIKFVRYGVPALLIILSILDFIKAIASESDDEMKKVTARFTKRLIAAALIFIIPFVLDFILRMFNIPGLNSENPFCSK